jgi:hypothetical protein
VFLLFFLINCYNPLANLNIQEEEEEEEEEEDACSSQPLLTLNLKKYL